MYQLRIGILGHLTRLVIFVVGLMYASLAVSNDKSKSGVFTVAVFGDAVYIGRAYPFGVRGEFHLKGYLKSDGECTGSYVYQKFPRGRVKFDCTNGLSGSMKIRADTPMTGKGSALVQGTRVKLVFGYGLKQTNRLLSLPGDRELAVENGALVLVEPK